MTLTHKSTLGFEGGVIDVASRVVLAVQRRKVSLRQLWRGHHLATGAAFS